MSGYVAVRKWQQIAKGNMIRRDAESNTQYIILKREGFELPRKI